MKKTMNGIRMSPRAKRSTIVGVIVVLLAGAVWILAFRHKASTTATSSATSSAGGMAGMAGMVGRANGTTALRGW